MVFEGASVSRRPPPRDWRVSLGSAIGARARNSRRCCWSGLATPAHRCWKQRILSGLGRLAWKWRRMGRRAGRSCRWTVPPSFSGSGEPPVAKAALSARRKGPERLPATPRYCAHRVLRADLGRQVEMDNGSHNRYKSGDDTSTLIDWPGPPNHPGSGNSRAEPTGLAPARRALGGG